MSRRTGLGTEVEFCATCGLGMTMEQLLRCETLVFDAAEGRFRIRGLWAETGLSGQGQRDRGNGAEWDERRLRKRMRKGSDQNGCPGTHSLATLVCAGSLATGTAGCALKKVELNGTLKCAVVAYDWLQRGTRYGQQRDWESTLPFPPFVLPSCSTVLFFALLCLCCDLSSTFPSPTLNLLPLQNEPCRAPAEH